MRKSFKQPLIFMVCLFIAEVLAAQTHISVPLDSQVYYYLEQAQLRGIVPKLPSARPYSRDFVFKTLNIILSSGENLPQKEKEIISRYIKEFSPPNFTGLQNANFYNETNIADNTPLTIFIGAGTETEFSSGIYLSSNNYWGTELWAKTFLAGDITRGFSWNISADFGLLRVPREYLGQYYIYYKDYEGNKDLPAGTIAVYSSPLSHFPFNYEKHWDGSVYPLDGLSSYDSWPYNGDAKIGLYGAYEITSEMSAAFLNGVLSFRLGRILRDWASAPLGQSLYLNKSARPFLALEAAFKPLNWLEINTLTGFLEYYNTSGIKASSSSFQNAFSISMITFNYKNYFTFEAGESVIWPKRFDAGYIAPLISKFFYQNNSGDFDNLAMFFTGRLQKPGLGNLWLSWFLDEANLLSDVFIVDRTMWAVQAGTEIALSFLPLGFSSLQLSYTKINPYCYTHNRIKTPWYDNSFMEQSYTNNGVSLGHYLPPNSDEILARYKCAPSPSITTSLQYQLIRHGADHGESAVDGSSLYSELDPEGRDEKPELKRFFLRDGAYQWLHIIKIAFEWKPRNLSFPLTFFGETGAVVSYFTNTKEKANSGSPHDYSVIDTAEYPKQTGIIVKFGIKAFL